MPSQFDPQPNEEFSIRIDNQEKRFQALPHPKAPEYSHAMQGGKALVYKVKALSASNYHYALKVMNFRHQVAELEQICSNLDKLKVLPGLVVCERQCLSPSRAPDTINEYRNLKYSILMPWIQGQSWFDVLALGMKGQNTLDKEGSFKLASNLIIVVSRLEASGISHCDLSAGNVIIDPDPQKLQIELIDVEDMYAPGYQKPKFEPLGTPGYQHKTSNKSQWHEQGDRFAAAILLAEMLGWYDDTVRSISYGESYFDPAELQSKGCKRFEVLSKAISEHDKELTDLFDRAWESDTFDECPTLKDWAQSFNRVKLDKYKITFDGDSIGPTIGTQSPPIWDPPPPPQVPKIEWEQPVLPQTNSFQWEVEPKAEPFTWDQSPQSKSRPTSTNPVEWDSSIPSPVDENENGDAN